MNIVLKEAFRQRGVELDNLRRQSLFRLTALFHVRQGHYWSVTSNVPTSTPSVDTDRALERGIIGSIDNWLVDKHLGGETAAAGW